MPYLGRRGHLPAGWPVSSFLGKVCGFRGLAGAGLLVSERMKGGIGRSLKESESLPKTGGCGGDEPRSPTGPCMGRREQARAAPVGAFSVTLPRLPGSGAVKREMGGLLGGAGPAGPWEGLIWKARVGRAIQWGQGGTRRSTGSGITV